jgi:hypothetical protein
MLAIQACAPSDTGAAHDNGRGIAHLPPAGAIPFETTQLPFGGIPISSGHQHELLGVSPMTRVIADLVGWIVCARCCQE